MDTSQLFSLLYDNSEFGVIDTYGESAAALTAYGTVNGAYVYSFCQNEGAFSTAQCKKIIALYDLAKKTGNPVVGFYSSDGVELPEGFNVLEAYGELLNTAFSVSGVIPQISVVLGNTLGVNTLMCNTADVVIALKDVDFYASSDGKCTTDSAYSGGIIDILCENAENAVNTAKNALSYFPQNNLSPLPEFELAEPDLSENIAEIIANAGSMLEVKAGYAQNVKTYFAAVGNYPAGIISFCGSALCPECAYKTEAFIKTCNAYNIPIITVADSEGFNNKNDVQLITALTKLASAYSNTTSAKISVISNSAIGGAYVMLAGKGNNADYVFAFENSVICPMPVDSAVAFMYGDRLANGEDRAALISEYKDNNASAANALNSGVVDKVITKDNARYEIVKVINMLINKRETTIPRKHTVK